VVKEKESGGPEAGRKGKRDESERENPAKGRRGKKGGKRDAKWTPVRTFRKTVRGGKEPSEEGQCLKRRP